MAILDLENKTLTTDDYSETMAYKASSNYKMQKVDANAVYSVVGGPNSNNYAQTITLTNTSAYDKAYVGTVETTQDEIADEDAIVFAEDGSFTISVKDIADGEPIPVAFHATKSGSWFNRTITIDRSAKTVVLDNVLADYTAVNEALASVPEDLTFYTVESAKAVQDAVDAVNTSKNSAEQAAVDAMAEAINEAVDGLEKAYAELELTSSLGMFHFDNPVQVVIKGETATVTIHSVTGSSRYDQMALGTYDEIITDPSKAIIGVVDEGNAEDGTNAYYFTFDIPVSQLAEGTTINYVLRYREGYSDTHDGDWYQGKSGDYYLTVGSLTLPHKLTETPAAEASCIKDGNTAYWTCSTCGKYFSDAYAGTEIEENSWTLPAKGHDLQAVAAVEPTCTLDGNTAYWTCSVCGKYFADENGEKEITEEDWTLPALGHSWNAGTVVTKAGTAKTKGSMLYTCTVCNEAKTVAIAYPKAATLEFTAAVYTGSAYKPAVTVKDSSGNEIKPSGNYTVKYTNNTNVGKATVTITFTGDKYTGTLTKTFMIRANTTKVSSLKSTAKGVKVTWKKVAGAAGYYVYRKGTSGAIATIKSGTTVSYVDTKAKTNGKAYKYRVKPYFDKTTVKNYSKTSVSAYKLTYYVARTAIKSVTNSASKTMTVKWKKNAKATGYQVKYVVGSTTKTVTVKGKASLSKVIKSLKKGKTYKVYVRAYKTVKGTNYFSAWSAVKSVKIKK